MTASSSSTAGAKLKTMVTAFKDVVEGTRHANDADKKVLLEEEATEKDC